MADHPSLDNNDDLADIEAMLRSLDMSELEQIEPPADVWAGIERALADQTGSSVASGVTPQAPSAPVAESNVVSLADRRRMRLLGPALGIAAAAVLAIAGIVVFSGRGDSSGEVIASAQLEFDAESFDPLGATASASADLVELDGHYEIVLTEANLPADLQEAADLELWLIEVDSDGVPVDVAPVSLLDGTEPGAYRVPDGLDPATHTLVDISVEPRDGDDAHSGRSILRGALTEA